MYLNKLSFTLFFLASLIACGPSDDMPDPNNLDFSCADNPGVCELTTAQNTFGWNLLERVYLDDPQKNIFLSPLSMATALSMTLNGTEGDTYAEMEKTLQWTGLGVDALNTRAKDLIEILPQIDGAVDFSIANSIWYSDEFPASETFLENNQTYYHSQVEALDFKDPNAKVTINNWVNDATNGLIDKIVDNILPDDVMFLINAIYFKGDWKYAFDPAATSESTFYLKDGSTATTSFMLMEEITLPYYEDPATQAIRLPYSSGSFGMTILLPQTDTEMESVISQLANDNYWNQIQDGLVETESIIRMPKFTMEYEEKMNRFLEAMGMPLAFMEGAADFSGIGPGTLFISRVKHKTFVEVSEEGTEAAGVTSVAVSTESISPYPMVNCNRPFLFVISDQATGSIQFVGQYAQPE